VAHPVWYELHTGSPPTALAGGVRLCPALRAGMFRANAHVPREVAFMPPTVSEHATNPKDQPAPDDEPEPITGPPEDDDPGMRDNKRLAFPIATVGMGGGGVGGGGGGGGGEGGGGGVGGCVPARHRRGYLVFLPVGFDGQQRGSGGPELKLSSWAGIDDRRGRRPGPAEATTSGTNRTLSRRP